jgi:hypothetical protein
MVYALVGLSKENAIKPDYEQKTSQVYINLVQHTMQSDSFLTFCVSGLTHRRCPWQPGDLPTWVPDLIDAPLADTANYHRMNYSSGQSLKPEFRIHATEGVIWLHGIVLDIIDECTSAPDPIWWQSSLEDAMSNTQNSFFATKVYIGEERIREARQLLMMGRPIGSSNDEEMTQAFWRTLTDDLNGQQYPDAEGVLSVFASLDHYYRLRFSDTESSSTLRKGESADKINEQEAKDETRSYVPEAHKMLRRFVQTRMFAVTKQKYSMLAPRVAEKGDVVVIIKGAPAPHVLRETGRGDSSYFFVGEAYVDGVMHGEAVNDDTQWTWFTIR